MKTINQRWKEFAAKVVAPDAPEIQHKEMKRAFFGGFASCMGAMGNEITEMSDDDGVKALESFTAQLRAFMEAVKLDEA